MGAHVFRAPPRIVAPVRHAGILYLPTRQFSRPSADQTDGSWTNEAGSNVNLYASVDELSPTDSDYIQSVLASVVADLSQVAISSLTDPVSSSGHKVRYRYRKYPTKSARIDLVVRLRQGTTQIAAWTHTNIDGNWATVEQTLSGAEADSITNYADLRIEQEAIEVP
jgi:hypothetical protein